MCKNKRVWVQIEYLSETYDCTENEKRKFNLKI